jgi:hypothetical protein
MKNSLVLLAVVLSVAAFAGMMRIKTDVQTMDRERMRLVRERAELRETKRVLEAEWALLASPDRLGRLVQGMGYVPASALDVVPLQGPSLAVSGGLVSGTVSLSTVVSPVASVSFTERVATVTPTGSAIEAVEQMMQAGTQPDSEAAVMPESSTEQE